MKKTILLFALSTFTLVTFAQFSDTSQLKTFIHDTIKDRRPDRVTAAQLQKALLGISQFLTPNAITKAGSGLTLDGDSLYFGGEKPESISYAVVRPTEFGYNEYIANLMVGDDQSRLSYKSKSITLNDYHGVLIDGGAIQHSVIAGRVIVNEEGVKIGHSDGYFDQADDVIFSPFGEIKLLRSGFRNGEATAWFLTTDSEGLLKLSPLKLAKGTPANSGDTNYSMLGSILFDDNYFYITTSEGLIKRVALSTF